MLRPASLCRWSNCEVSSSCTRKTNCMRKMDMENVNRKERREHREAPRVAHARKLGTDPSCERDGDNWQEPEERA